MNAYNALELVLHQRLETVVTTDLIKYPNIIYDDSQETAIWVRPSLLYGSAESATLGRDGLNFVRGVYQVSIFTARNTGTKPSNDYAKLILDAFPKGDRLTFTGGVIMINVGYQSTNLLEEQFLHTPVTIPFTAHMEV
jgi:hypothetical protein